MSHRWWLLATVALALACGPGVKKYVINRLEPGGEQIGDLDQREVVAQIDDLTQDAALGCYLVALAEAGDQLLVLLLALHLGADHEKVEDDDQPDRKQEAFQAGLRCGSGRGLGQGIGNKEAHTWFTRDKI